VEKVSAPDRLPAAVDCFALFGEPRRPWLDLEALKTRFLQLTGTVHPDKTAGDKAEATRQFAELNAAYQRLSDHRQRLRHLLELESDVPLSDVQQIPPGAMDLLMEIGQACREADPFIARRESASPLLKAHMMETGMGLTDRLTSLKRQVETRQAEIWAELQGMNAEWAAAPSPGTPERASALPLARLEQHARALSYLARGAGQIQERLTQLML
jgi:curved DNA-binding protein CbpA